jgi:hypothetical protein
MSKKHRKKIGGEHKASSVAFLSRTSQLPHLEPARTTRIRQLRRSKCTSGLSCGKLSMQAHAAHQPKHLPRHAGAMTKVP